ncbi:40S ribosomal protein S12-like [Psammomys obesus]|uniref:40S ribosomal protein S12-like n=1 Tax=Psammomys obesus TaxID=48139 RepID=UPI002452CD80|nr:40S ribosomal protein S12-like [Psammomys obesus]
MAEEGIAAGGAMDVSSALQAVLKPALMCEGLALEGLGDATKASDKCQARLCVLAANRDEPMYFRPVEAHCAEHQINLLKADHTKKPGQWVGRCQINEEGKPRKVVGSSCVLLKDYGEGSQAKDVSKEYFQCRK